MPPQKTALSVRQTTFIGDIFSFLFHNHSFAFKLSLSLRDFEKKKIQKNRFYD